MYDNENLRSLFVLKDNLFCFIYDCSKFANVSSEDKEVMLLL